MSLRCIPLTVLGALAFAPVLAAQPPAQRKVMITEVSPYGRQAVELQNFDTVAADLAGWTIRWRHGGVTYVSAPLDFGLTANRVAVIDDPNGAGLGPIPGHVGIHHRLPLLNVPFGASVTVGLVDAAGVVTDEVRILGLATGSTSQGSVGGTFRGLARPGAVSSGAPTVERIWGLDSDSAGDWCRAEVDSFGLENLCSGPRGVDPAALEGVVINEVDVTQSILGFEVALELQNRHGAVVDMTDWFLLVSGAQGQIPVTISPFPAATPVAAGGYVVLRQSHLPPQHGEIAPGATIVNLTTTTGMLSLGSSEYSIALYDDLGRLADLVRATASGTEVVHNHPRAPGAWDAFRGAARRVAGSRGIGRAAGAPDTGTGADWRPTAVRSLGAPNAVFAAGPGDAAAPDVRLHAGVYPNRGLSLTVNAGPALAGARFYLLFSLVRSDGLGPILGLAPDCLDHFLLYGIGGLEPAAATLDVLGSYRFLLPPQTFPPGIATDNLGVVTSPSLPFGAMMTRVLEFDT